MNMANKNNGKSRRPKPMTTKAGPTRDRKRRYDNGGKLKK